MKLDAALELAWDLKSAVETLSHLADITQQRAANALLQVFDSYPGAWNEWGTVPIDSYPRRGFDN